MNQILRINLRHILTGILLLSAAAYSAPSSSGLARCTAPVPREGKAHDRFLLINERVQQAGAKAKVVFVGDSITEGWEFTGKAVWDKYYAPRNAVNLGISSDHTQHVLWRLENGNLAGLKPAVAVVLIGVNNVPDDANSPGDVLAGVSAVVQKLRQALPATKILLLGIFPFREDFNPQRGKALQVNQALHTLEANGSVTYLDLGHLLIQPNGKISKEVMRDFLHPTAMGYRIWAEAMEPKLAELLGESPVRP